MKSQRLKASLCWYSHIISVFHLLNVPISHPSALTNCKYYNILKYIFSLAIKEQGGLWCCRELVQQLSRSQVIHRGEREVPCPVLRFHHVKAMCRHFCALETLLKTIPTHQLVSITVRKGPYLSFHPAACPLLLSIPLGALELYGLKRL